MKTLVFVNQYGSTPLTGFGGRYFYIAQELSSKCNVMLVSCANHHLLRSKPQFEGLFYDEICEGVLVRWVKLLPYSSSKSPIRVINWFLFSFLLPVLLFKKRFDVLLYSSPSPVAFAGAWFISFIKRSKLVFDVRDVWPETLIELGGYSKYHPLIFILSALERFAYKRADYITSNLINFNIRLKELKFDESKFHWIPNGISVDEIELSINNSKFEFPDNIKDKRIISYTGTLGDANNLLPILEAAVYLKDRSDIFFVFIGDGLYKNFLFNFCESRGLKNVLFLDALGKIDIYKAQSKSDILCIGAHPSKLYRYGVAANKLYEYLYSETPVIYYIDTPNYTPVKDMGCGIELKSADGEGIAIAISEILSDYRLYKKKANKKKFEKIYSYSSISDKLLKVITS